MSIYTHTGKFMFAWPLIAFTILCLLNTNTQQTLEKKPSALVLIRNGGCNPFSNIFFFNVGVNESNTINILFFSIFKTTRDHKRKSSHKCTFKMFKSKVQFSSDALHDTRGVIIETNPSLYYNYSKSISYLEDKSSSIL